MHRQNWLEEMDQIGKGGCSCSCGSSSGGCCNRMERKEDENTRIIMITRRRERLRIRKDKGRCWSNGGGGRDLSRILAIFLVILSVGVGSSVAVMAYQNDLSGIASSSSSSSSSSMETMDGLLSSSVATSSSSSNRLGCVWSRTAEGIRNSNSASVTPTNNGNNGQQSSNSMYAPGNNPFQQQRQQHQTFSSTKSLSSPSSSAVSPFYTSSLLSSSSLPSSSSSSPGESGGVLTLSCNVRTLNADFSNYTSASSFTREQKEQTMKARIQCSDKLLFQSFLFPNQTLFQLRNLRELEVDSCKIRKVPKAVFSSWRFLKTLEIHTNNFQWASSIGLELEAGAFQGLETLEVLDLSHSNIWNLFPEQNVLCPMRNLVKLNVSWNRLTDIDDFGMEKNPGSREDPKDPTYYCTLNIQNLDLSSNFLRRIGKSGFSRLNRLVQLKLRQNLIEELEDKAFSGLNQLKHLDMSSNRLVALPPSIFSKKAGGPGNLQEIVLSNNSISALSPQVFEGLDQLLLLDLSRNFIQSLPGENIFSGLIRLVVLKLSFNQLSTIPTVLFNDLISLQALFLDNNNIEVIQPEAFANLRNLNTLDLSHNRLSSIDSHHFSNLFVLKQLFLDHNELRQMPEESLKNCTSLEDLGISQNKLTQVPVAIQGLGQLKTLDLGENRITSLNNVSFRGLSQIYGLRLVDNRISELPAGFCDSMKNLRVLNSAQNRITRVSSTSFVSCPHVRALRLDSNLLEEVPSLTDQLPSLLWLNVSDNNRLKWVDYRLLPPTLEWLDVSHNQLTSLTKPDSIPVPVQQRRRNNGKGTTFNLRVLDASFNQLTSLDHTHIPPLLDTLRLNHNKIKSIAPDTFTTASRLRRVELIGNEIEILPLSSIKFSQIPMGKRLPELYLKDNPFICECSMEWLTRVNQLEVLRQYPRIDVNSLACRPTFSRSSTSLMTKAGSRNNSSLSSSSNQGVISLLEVKPKDFICPYKTHCFATCGCCEFEFCDCQNVCPSNCTCYRDSSWGSNIVDCSYLQYTQVPPRIPMDATEIYLDGNVFGNELSSHIFIGKKNVRVLYLNNSQIESVKNKTFNGLKSLEVLHLQDNLLQEIQGYEFSDVTGLKELYLQNNMIRTIGSNSFEKLVFLQILRIDGNLLVDYNVWQLKTTNANLHSLMLSGNKWSCDCNFIIPFRRWVSSLKNTIIVDYSLARCYEEDGELENGNNTNSSSSAAMTLGGSTIPATVTTTTTAATMTAKLISGMCNDNLSFMNNHISSVGGVGAAPTVNNNFGSHLSGPYHHAHLENPAGNYGKEFPQNENIIATTSAAAAGERGGRRSSKGSSGGGSGTSDGDNFSENSTFLICLATFIAIVVVASTVFLFGLLTRKSRGLSSSSSSAGAGSWWLCCFSKCGINGNSAIALAKCLSAQSQTSSSTRNEGESNDGTFPGSYYYSESGKLFDAYFIYTQQDEEFVEKLTGEMEQGGVPHQHYYPPSTNSGYKLKLLFQRDLCLAPPWNSEMIQSACEASKRIVLIISNDFLKTEWSNAHFRAALLTAIRQNWRKLIVIKLHDESINEDYWKTMLAACEHQQQQNGSGNNKQGNNATFPVLEWTDKNFWQKFKLLLPQHPLLMQGGNNRNDLIPPSSTNNFPTISSTTSQQLPYATHLNMNGMNILNPAAAPFLPYQIAQQSNQHHQPPPNFVTLMNWSGQQHGFPMGHLPPIPPQNLGYSNIDSFQNHPNNQQQQHIMTSLNNLRTSIRQNPHHHHNHPHLRHHSNLSGDVPQHIHSLSQLSSPNEANYSSSAVSSGNDEFDHVYSTLDSPMSDMAPQFEGQLNRHQIQHSHSNSSGISSGSDVDATSGTGGCHPVPPMYFV